jgi:hypothetical protein
MTSRPGYCETRPRFRNGKRPVRQAAGLPALPRSGSRHVGAGCSQLRGQDRAIDLTRCRDERPLSIHCAFHGHAGYWLDHRLSLISRRAPAAGTSRRKIWRLSGGWTRADSAEGLNAAFTFAEDHLATRCADVGLTARGSEINSLKGSISATATLMPPFVRRIETDAL